MLTILWTKEWIGLKMTENEADIKISEMTDIEQLRMGVVDLNEKLATIVIWICNNKLASPYEIAGLVQLIGQDYLAMMARMMRENIESRGGMRNADTGKH